MKKEQILIYSILTIVILLPFDTYGQTKGIFPMKLKVGTYNVGHFNQGRLGGFQGTGNIVKAELNNWRSWIGQQSLDIFGLNEWNEFFSKDSVYNARQELLNPYYSHIYFGKENKWIYNGIATNYRLHNIQQKDLDGDYYALIGELKVGDLVVHIISVHVPWQKKWHSKSTKELVDLLNQYKYFICLGDMNAKDVGQLLFVKSGFNVANGGYMGWFPTASGTSSSSGYQGGANVNIDNIITSSNIKIMKVEAPKTGLNDLDHLPIIADVIITW